MIHLYPEGIEKLHGDQRLAIRWADVREVWFNAVQVEAGGLIGAAVGVAMSAARRPESEIDADTTNMTIELVGQAGERLRLTSNDRGVGAAFGEILAQVNPRLLAEARRRIQGAQPAIFGPLKVSRHGITYGSKAPVAFSEVEGFYLKEGKLRLKKRGAGLDAFAVSVKSIPNVFVLTDLFAELKSGTFTEGGRGPTQNLAQSRVV